ncbi:MAG: bifunctional [glutamine synthetase] adenylyltransferase/[glutamine synthetase]-adenylyl-L-tyrosine phosphorylase [Azospirillum sp.]|nr:bifunctional [glutamine synthetase] adenylyltransferase/[glutamine synthetase]-adenylyl-L-tyrosine phosphorylase [Azospirillum sp.]
MESTLALSSPLPRPGDPALAEIGIGRWREHAAEADAATKATALALLDDPQGRKLLDGVFGCSPYLGQLLLREQGFICRLLRDGFDPGFDRLLATVQRDQRGETDTNRLMAGLRSAKRQVALLTALADLAGAWPLERVTGALSAFAELALRLAAGHLLTRAAAAGKLRVADPHDPERSSGLIILAMGKFGGFELNYSSDIDLIVLYDAERASAPANQELAPIFIRLARDLVRIMEERTRDGYVFRTDLRLRPDPGATPPAVSVAAAELYYAGFGQNWERAALIKARAVAGDLEAGRQFLDSLRPFVWRRNLDFAAIRDIHSIKRQINAHKGHGTIAIEGHNIKLGRGGIREIEFFAQTQQLIFGGRDDRVRVAPTCLALAALVDTGRVTAAVADDLVAAYHFLRQVEHRLQMIDDLQTHSLPATDAGVAALAAFLGYDGPAPFRRELLSHLATVETHYAELFEEAPALAEPGSLVFTGTEDDPRTSETLHQLGYANPSAVISTVANWHRGRYRAVRSARARELLTELGPTLLRAFARTPAPDTTLTNFDRFLGRLPAGVQLFSLFYTNPNLFDLVAEIMGLAPALAETLGRNAPLLDAVLLDGFFKPLPDAATLARRLERALVDARDFEDVLLLSRRWANDQKFRAGVHTLRNITDGDHCGQFLSDLACLVIAELLDRVTVEFARRHGRIPGSDVAVVALGKLGARQMSAQSDLDLIVVYDLPPEPGSSDGAKPLAPSEYFTRLTQRLINAITVPTAEGRLYEVDMRLRPSGNAGPLAVSFAAFVKYQTEQAWTWEHLALTRARPIAGSASFRTRLAAAIRDRLTQPRDPDRLLRDVDDMRRRVDREFGNKNPWDVKYLRGGMIDVSFVAQYLQLRHAHDHPDVLSSDTVTALDRLAGRRLLDAAIAEDLISAQRLWRRVQGYLRLTTEPKKLPAVIPTALAPGLTRAAFPTEPEALAIDVLETRIRAVAARAFQHYRSLIEEPAARLPPLPEAKESPDDR